MDLKSEIPKVRGEIDVLFMEFAARKMALRDSQVWIFAPSGFETLDELMENLTLLKTGKIEKRLIFLYNTKFWQGLLKWLQMAVCGSFLADSDFENCFILTDDIDEICDNIKAIL